MLIHIHANTKILVQPLLTFAQHQLNRFQYDRSSLIFVFFRTNFGRILSKVIIFAKFILQLTLEKQADIKLSGKQFLLNIFKKS